MPKGINVQITAGSGGTPATYSLERNIANAGWTVVNGSIAYTASPQTFQDNNGGNGFADGAVVQYRATATNTDGTSGYATVQSHTVSSTATYAYFSTTLGSNVTKNSDADYLFTDSYGGAVIVSNTAILTGDFKLKIDFNQADTQGFMIGVSETGGVRAYNDGTSPWEYGVNSRSSGGNGRTIINGTLSDIGALNWGADTEIYLERVSGVLFLRRDVNGNVTDLHNYGNVGTGAMFALASHVTNGHIRELQAQ